MFAVSKYLSDTAWSAARNPTWIAASFFPDIDHASPSRRATKFCTAPSPARLNVGAGDGIGVGDENRFGVGTIVGEPVGGKVGDGSAVVSATARNGLGTIGAS